MYRADFRADGHDDVLDLRNVTGEAARPKPTPANANELTVGDKTPDGTIYAGISPDTGKSMFAMPQDASLAMKWKAAMEYAKDLDANGHKGWRLPSRSELNVLFNNRAAIGGFNVTGARIPRAGTGPLPRTLGGMRGASASATGIRTTTIRAVAPPCGVSASRVRS